MFLTAGNVQSIATNFAFLLKITTFHAAKIRKISVRGFFCPKNVYELNFFN